MILNLLLGAVSGFMAHELLEKPTREIFSKSQDVTRLAQYAEGGCLVLTVFAVFQFKRYYKQRHLPPAIRMEIPHHLHSVADLSFAFLWTGLGTVIGYMFDALREKR